VVKQLKVTLLGAVPKVRTTDPEAYALYLQAVNSGGSSPPRPSQQSDALFRKVLAIDPALRTSVGRTGSQLHQRDEPGPAHQGGVRPSREAAMKALAIDPEYAPPIAELGFIAMLFDNDLAGAAEHFKHALALDPADLDVLRNSAVLLQSLGRLDEALALDEAVVRRDPVNVNALFNLGLAQRFSGRFDAAIASQRTALSLSPGRGGARAQIGLALLLNSDAPSALAEIEQETSEIWKDDQPADGVPRTRAQGRLRRGAGGADREAREGCALQHRVRLRVPRRSRSGPSSGSTRQSSTATPGLSEIVAENLFDKIHSDPALAAVPAQARQGAGATGEDRVQGDAAGSGCHRCRTGADGQNHEQALAIREFKRRNVYRAAVIYAGTR
jgi:tetratricopeptide (TPR) repeat protein